MGKCKDCKRDIITWWGPRCWACTGKHLERRMPWPEEGVIRHDV